MIQILFIFVLLASVNLSALEKIYALMVTGKDHFHQKLAEKSIESFLAQTYENKHLIIVNDGDYTFQHLEGDLITEIKPEHKLDLGTLRNLSLDAVPQGAVWIQWDDDDWHHSKLMEEQYWFLRVSGAFAILLKNQVRYASLINTAWIARGGDEGICGTIMSRKKEGLYYPELKKAEDAVFLDQLQQTEEVKVWDNHPFYYLRFIHGKNTWDPDHFELSNRSKNNFDISLEGTEYLQSVLQEHYTPIFDFFLRTFPQNERLIL